MAHMWWSSSRLYFRAGLGVSRELISPPQFLPSATIHLTHQARLLMTCISFKKSKGWRPLKKTLQEWQALARVGVVEGLSTQTAVRIG